MEYLITTAVIVLLLILFDGFFSGAEISLVSADKNKLRYQAKKGSKSASLIVRLFQKPEWLLVTSLTGTNITVVTASTITAAAMLQIFPEFGDLITILILTPCTLFFAEILSKSIFQQKADHLATKVIYPLYFFSWVFSPIVFVMTRISNWISALVGAKDYQPSIFVTKEELKVILETAVDGSDVRQHERSMIQRLFEFSEISAREAMIPLIDISAIPRTATVADAIESLNQTDFSWVLVYSNRIDLITGYIDYFDLLKMNRTDPIRTLIKPVYYIPPNKKLHALLLEMQEEKINFTVIVDEYGGAEGIITIEDILEEVVGDIVSEHEKRSPLFRIGKGGQYFVQGRIEVHQFNEQMPFEFEIPEGDYATVGGFVISMLEKIPQVGDSFQYKEHFVTIEKADARSVIEVSIASPPPADELAEEELA